MGTYVSLTYHISHRNCSILIWGLRFKVVRLAFVTRFSIAYFSCSVPVLIEPCTCHLSGAESQTKKRQKTEVKALVYVFKNLPTISIAFLDKLCPPASVDRRDSATRVYDINDHRHNAAAAAQATLAVWDMRLLQWHGKLWVSFCFFVCLVTVRISLFYCFEGAITRAILYDLKTW